MKWNFTEQLNKNLTFIERHTMWQRRNSIAYGANERKNSASTQSWARNLPAGTIPKTNVTSVVLIYMNRTEQTKITYQKQSLWEKSKIELWMIVQISRSYTAINTKTDSFINKSRSNPTSLPMCFQRLMSQLYPIKYLKYSVTTNFSLRSVGTRYRYTKAF